MQQQNQTYAQQWQQRNVHTKQQVCQLLHWTQMDYAEYQYKMGIAYLMWYLPVNEKLRAEYESSKLYWNWFKNIWLCYDESWITYSLSLSECTLQMRLKHYQELHCPRELVREKKPSILYTSIKKEEAA